MQRLTIIVLSVLMFFQSIHLNPSDLWYMDDFVKHAVQHAQSGNNFIEFLSMHYGNKSREHFPEHREHKNLPFHHTQDFSNAQYFVFNSINQISKCECLATENNTKFHYYNFYSFFGQKPLVQPPII